MEDSIILQMREITKVFPGVRALDGVTLEVRRGEIHSICGENGAGKSTLMKVLSGVYPYGSYEGQIIYMGEEARFKNIKESEHAGIVIIHQELTMIPELSITENIFMGNEIVKNGLIDWDEARQRTVELMERVGLNLNPNTLIKNLGVGQQQLVEIAKALSKNVKLLILDEPTSGLDPLMQEKFFFKLAECQKNGTTIFLSSHNLSEVQKYCSRVALVKEGHIEMMPDLSTLPMHSVELVTSADCEFLLETLHATGISKENGRIRFMIAEKALLPLLRMLADMDVSDVSITKPSLEQMFHKIYYGEESDA